MAEVVFQQVRKTFDSTVVIRDFSLTVEDGEFLVLVGPSGCGKSTVLRLLAGLEAPTSGELRINAKRVNEVSPKDRDIAMVFQNYALYPHMSVYDNLAFGLKMRKVPKPERHERVTAVAEMLELTPYLQRKPKQLSGGQRQRVALGRAIVRNAQVFLMDEPLSNLDAKLRVQMRAEISRLHQRLKTTTLYVTHDQTEAMTMGSRIVVLNQGVIQQVDKPLTLYNYPENLFVAGFLGQLNILSGILTQNALQLGEGTQFVLPEALLQTAPHHQGQQVSLGIRPEHFSVVSSEETIPHAITVTPDLLEPLGSEVLVHFDVGGTRLVAKLPATVPVSLGQALSLSWDAERAHLFEPESGKRL